LILQIHYASGFGASSSGGVSSPGEVSAGVGSSSGSGSLVIGLVFNKILI
jgi:hypothetical protein